LIVNVSFNASTTNFVLSDVVVTNGTVDTFTGSGSSYSFRVSPLANGLISVRVPAGAATDATAMGNLASNTQSVTYSAPVVTMGVTGAYYAGKNFETLRFTRIDPNIKFIWPGAPDAQLPADNFSVRWTGCIVAGTTGNYDLVTRSDDGVRLWVNNVSLVSNWTNHGETWDGGTVTLTAGVPVPFIMEFYDATADAIARLWWQGPGVAFAPIPNSALRINENGMNTAPYPATFSAWQSSARAPLSSLGDDGDGDPALLEYALGSSASTGVQTAGSGLQLMQNDGQVTANLTLPAFITDISYSLESSADLISWSPSGLQAVVTNPAFRAAPTYMGVDRSAAALAAPAGRASDGWQCGECACRLAADHTLHWHADLWSCSASPSHLPRQHLSSDRQQYHASR